MRLQTVKQRVTQAVKIGTLIAFFVLSASAFASDKSDIQALFHKVEKGVMAKDVKAIQAAGTADFTYTEAGQTMTADQTTAGMEAQFKMIQGTPKCKMAITSCVIKDKEARVKFNDNTQMTVMGEDKKTHKMVEASKCEGVMVKTDTGWLMKSITVITTKMTMDGKPFTLPADPASK